MKKSNWLLLIFCLVFFVFIQLTFFKYMSGPLPALFALREQVHTSGVFTGIKIMARNSAFGGIRISRNPAICKVTARLSRKAPALKFVISDGVLCVDLEPLKSTPVEIIIEMPELVSLEVTGLIPVTIENFQGVNLKIISSLGVLTGINCLYENIDVTAEVGNLLLSKSLFKKANLNLSGMSNVFIKLENGSLAGTISGISRVLYLGDIKEQAIRIRGFASVTRYPE